MPPRRASCCRGLLLPHLLLYAALPLAAAVARAPGARPGAARRAVRLRAGQPPSRLAAGSLLCAVPAVRVADAQPSRGAPPDHAGQHAVVARAPCWRARPARRRRPRQAIGLDAGPGRAGDAPQAAAVRAGGGRDRARRQLGAERLCAPDHAATGRAAGDQLQRTCAVAAPTPRCRCRACSRRWAGATTTRRAFAAAKAAARGGPRRRAVHWRDNQAGCKGVCDGLPHEIVHALNAPGLCPTADCLDEGLLLGLDAPLRAAARARSTQLLVLHMIGNHGPSYFGATRRRSRASRRRARRRPAAARATRSSTPTTTRCSTPTMCWRR